MSRLFEALQRSDGEGFSLEFPQPDSLANEILKTQQAAEAAEPQVGNALQFVSATLAPPRENRLVCFTDKESLGAEKFRYLAVRLRQMGQSRSLKRLLITSTVPEEGKSLVSANVALTLARKKPQSVLLVDGDMRRPVLAREFGIQGSPGLSEWLLGSSMQLPSILSIDPAGLCFLPAGRPPENPLELMQSGRLAELLERLTSSFDWILVDSPPVLPLGDTSVWTRLADGVLLVVREGVTRKRELQRGLEALDKSKLLGTLLNSCTNVDHGNYYQRYSSAPSKSESQVE